MRKLTFAITVLAALGGAALTAPASAAPGAPMGVAAPETNVSTVQAAMMRHRHERRMMRHRMERRMMHRRMERRMMHRRMERRMMRRGM